MSFENYLKERLYQDTLKEDIIKKIKEGGKSIIKGILSKLFPKEINLITNNPEQALDQIVKSKINFKELKNELIQTLKSNTIDSVTTESTVLLIEKINWGKVGAFLNKYKGPILLALITIIVIAFGVGTAYAGDIAQQISDKTDLINQITEFIKNTQSIPQNVPYNTGIKYNNQFLGIGFKASLTDQIQYVHNLVDYFKNAGLSDSSAIEHAKMFFDTHLPKFDINNETMSTLYDLTKLSKKIGGKTNLFTDLAGTSSQLFDYLISQPLK